MMKDKDPMLVSNQMKIKSLLFVIGCIGYFMSLIYSIYLFHHDSFELSAAYGISAFIFIQAALANFERDTVSYYLCRFILQVMPAILGIVIVYHKIQFRY